MLPEKRTEREMIETRFVLLAEAFWNRASDLHIDSPDLAASIEWALPVTIVDLPSLTIELAAAWARRHRLRWNAVGSDRPLFGCLLSGRGHGHLFIDADDPPDVRRFTLAHEAAHFLLDCLTPRERAIAALGPAITDVLDGDRPPTNDERIHAVLAGVTLGLHTHLMERRAGGLLPEPAGRSEEDADTLAFELLAPQAAARPLVRAHGAGAAALAERFGLPRPQAEAYARRLRGPTAGPSVRDWLGGGAAR